MLNSIKNWGKKLSSSRMLCADLEATIYDPRELPRPLRSDHEEVSMCEDDAVQRSMISSPVQQQVVEERAVVVANYRPVVDHQQQQLPGGGGGECVVCWEGLGGLVGPLLGCPSCNKLICGMCAPRLQADTCPFCRAPLPFRLKSNRLAHRIARYVDLPNRIHKLSKRVMEELPVACPFSSSLCSCKWKQKSRLLGAHLFNAHATQLMGQGQGTFSAAVADIVAEQVSSQICSFCVVHDGVLLLCRLSKINSEQIGLSLTTTAMPPTQRPFSLLIRIRSETHTLRGIVHFPSTGGVSSSKEFNFSWRRISPPTGAGQLAFDFKIKPT